MTINNINLNTESIKSVIKTVKHKKHFLNSYKNCLKQILENDSCNQWLTKLYSFNKDIFTHSVNVSVIAAVIYHNENIKDIKMLDVINSGLFHDIGKCMISREILLSSTKLSKHEKRLISLHPEFGYNILANIPISNIAKRGVLFHHENFGGNGYPNNKRNEEIPLTGRILKIADVYDALVSKRSYKEAKTPISAASYIIYDTNFQFDKSLMTTMHRIVNFADKEEHTHYGNNFNKTTSRQNYRCS